METWRRTWAEIDIDCLRFNYNQIRRCVSENSEICCVVKANGYGHNALRVARELSALGASWFAVSNIEEALQLRYGGITASVLILGYTPINCATLLAENDISQCVYSYEYAKELALANQSEKKIKIHIKIDTGMGRIGFSAIDTYDAMTSVDEIFDICSLDALETEGIFTHFAISDAGKSGEDYTRRQYENFMNIVDSLGAKGVSFKYKHCSNSAAVFEYPEYQMDMVRAGIVLYGLLPADEVKAPELRPVMSLKSVISFVKNVKRGTSLSYGCEYVAERDMRIATVPIGYAYGFFRTNFSGGGKVMVNGVEADIVGRVCMDQMMIDVSSVDSVNMGDEVLIFGREGITADTLARINGTINYEIICAVGERVPRVFKENGEVSDIVDAVFKI